MLEIIISVCLIVMVVIFSGTAIVKLTQFKKPLVWVSIGDNLYIAPIFGHEKWFVIHNTFVKNNSISLYLESFSGRTQIMHSDLEGNKSGEKLIAIILEAKKMAEQIYKSY